MVEKLKVGFSRNFANISATLVLLYVVEVWDGSILKSTQKEFEMSKSTFL